MNISIRAPRFFWAGSIYATAGAVGYVLSWDYPFGSSARMGPGYFPFLISVSLMLVGLVSIVRSFRLDGEPIGALAWKPIGLVSSAILAFALLIDTVGLVGALTAAIFISASASEHFRFDGKALIGMLALVAICSLVFVKGLGVPMPLLGPWIQNILPAGLGG